MSADLNKLEQDLKREMALLRELPLGAPRAECLARVKAAVLAESARVLRRRRVLRFVRVGGIAAAVALVAVGWTVFRPRATEPAVTDADAVLAEWAAAFDESNSRLTNLAEYGWAHGELGRDEDAELDGLLQSLDQSFERFDAL